MSIFYHAVFTNARSIALILKNTFSGVKKEVLTSSLYNSLKNKKKGKIRDGENLLFDCI
ncbi:hypothetical protein BACI9J_130113 [Bacillus altitudinis]|nr:hypothetical protein BACI9J_130113 [Bacillus altitudinis]